MTLIGASLFLLTGCSDFVDQDQLNVVPEAAVTLEAGHPVGQTFVARHGGLSGVEFWLEPSPGSIGVLRLHLRADSRSPTDLAGAELPLKAVTAPGFYRFSFPPDNGSHGMYRYAFLELEYEHHENGAGLLALLEAEGLADPTLSAANRDYLARNRRGWRERFRVTDDALVYQPEWIYNAYFQSLYTSEFPEENARRSFEWLLLQALP